MLVLVGIAAWTVRRPLLVAVGSALDAEDALVPVDVIVISSAAARQDALEAARLYHDGVSRRLVVAEWFDDPLDAELHRIGVPHLDVTALARSILEHSAVPPEAVTVLPGPVAGTEDEVVVAADYVRTVGARSVLFLAPRTHTARARWLLRRRLPPAVKLVVRSARLDSFDVDGWWRYRDQSRDVMAEYARWLNSALLGDAWHSRLPTRG
jgi:uncharacterized SAM-binding protein YcdF (DUF218 family)